MRKNSNKNMRINAEVTRELSDIIRSDIKDPRIGIMTSVTDAIVTPDLKYCTVYISVLGGDKEFESTLAGLNSAMGYIRRELAHRINLRNTPELRFVADKSLEYGMHMDEMISKVIEHDANSSRVDEIQTDNVDSDEDTED